MIIEVTDRQAETLIGVLAYLLDTETGLEHLAPLLDNITEQFTSQTTNESERTND
jgi:hypothetical protein